MSTILFNKISIPQIKILPIEKCEKNIYISNIVIDKININTLNIIAEQFKVISIHKKCAKIVLEFTSDIFYKFMVKLERYILDYIVDNSAKIYGLKCNGKKIKYLYDNKIKLNLEDLGNPIIKVRYENLVVMDAQGTLLNIDNVEPGMMIIPIFRIKNICFFQYKIKLNMTISLVQVLSQNGGVNNVSNVNSSNVNSNVNSYSGSNGSSYSSGSNGSSNGSSGGSYSSSEYSSFTNSDYYKRSISKNK